MRESLSGHSGEQMRQEVLALVNDGHLDRAEKLIQSSLAKDPHNANNYNNLGQVQALMGSAPNAIKSLRKALAIDPGLTPAWITCIKLVIAASGYNEAFTLLNQAYSSGINPDELLVLHIEMLNDSEKYASSLLLVRSHEASLNPDIAVGHINSLIGLGLYDEAYKTVEGYLSKGIRSYKLDVQHAMLCQEQGDSDAAMNILMNSMSSNGEKQEITSALVTVLEDLGEIDQAINNAERVINLDQGRFGHILFELYAKRGNLKKAWGYHSYRWMASGRISPTTFLDIPRLTELGPEQRVYIHKEQGIGDDILAYRITALYVLGNKDAASFFFEVDQKLLGLLPSLPNLTVIPSRGEPFKEFADLACTHQACSYDLVEIILSDSRLFDLLTQQWLHNTLEEKISKHLLSLTPIKSQKNAKFLHTKAGTIGLSWRSNNPLNGKTQSLRPDDLATFLAEHVNEKNLFVSLQYLPTRAEQDILALHNGHAVVPDCDFYDDIHSLFAWVSSCERIISVSNVVAHVAGLLGKRCDLLLAPGRASLWYWSLADQDYSIVYPAIRIRRKLLRHGPWGPLLADSML